MDLAAYANIDNLDELAQLNNIIVPRLRGYRLMSQEEPIDIKNEINKEEIAISCVEELCTSIPFWNGNPSFYELSYETDLKRAKYLIVNKDENGIKEYIGVRWNRIHGWKRKVLKTYIHNEITKRVKQWEIWNKYAGRDDILYIHSRIGGGNWSYYCKDVVDKEWFIEKVDDSFDSTYCDIYAKITKFPESNNE